MEPNFTSGFIKRMNAHALDLAMLSAISFLIIIITMAYTEPLLIRLITIGLTFIILEILIPLKNEGRTLGKKWIQVQPLMRTTHQPLTPLQIILRPFTKYGLMIVSYGMTHLGSFFMISERKDRRAIHDLILNTYVIDTEQKENFYNNDDYENKRI